MKIKNYVGFLFIILLTFNCSAPEKTTKNIDKQKKVDIENTSSELNIKIDKNVSWVNLMPGSEPKFHISGKLSLLKGENYNNEKTTLKYVKIFQSGKEIYFVQPKVREEFSNSIKNFSYSTIRGLSINQDLKIDKPIDMEYIFSDPNGKFTHTVKNINIEEAH